MMMSEYRAKINDINRVSNNPWLELLRFLYENTKIRYSLNVGSQNCPTIQQNPQ